VLITPTQRKDYRNPHVARVWALSEQALRSAKRAIIVGYSLPEDDLDVIYLLKRGLANLASTQPSKITIVEKVTDGDMPLTDHPVGRRYRSLFGPDICWQTGGFEGLNARLGKWVGLI
jgi:hypothetical protein